MATTTTSDPYKVLGVATDADAATIKKAYRKLVLSCHPDKVTDESLKEQKQEEFHQIQQAYETVGDPDNRNKYELELRAKKQKEDRDRAASKSSTAQYRNVNIYTAQHPSEYRGSSSKHSSPVKPTAYKGYSAEFSKSWDHNVGSRSSAYEAERKTRRTYSDERLNDDPRERKRREEDRDRDRRLREQEAEERRAKHARREKEREELERRERARAREAKEAKEAAAWRKEQDRIRLEQKLKQEKAERKARERAAVERERSEAKRRQEEEKLEEEERRSRFKKSSKKDSPRDKTPSKARDRTSPRDEVIPDLPTSEDSIAAKTHSNLAFAAGYIQAKKSSKASTPSTKYTPDTRAAYSDAYPDPNKWVPKRRVSGEKPSKMTTEGPSMDGAHSNKSHSAPTSPSSPIQGGGGGPPRLQKSHTMNHVPTADGGGRPTLNRAQTFDADAYMRSSMSGGGGSGGFSSEQQRPRLARQRTAAVDDAADDYYSPTPRVHKYSVGREKGLPRTFADPATARYADPYATSSGGTFPRVKTAQTYGPEHLASTKTRFDDADVNFVGYMPQQQAYVA